MTKDPSYALVQRIPDGGQNQIPVKNGDDAKRQMDAWAATEKNLADRGEVDERDGRTRQENPTRENRAPGSLPADDPGRHGRDARDDAARGADDEQAQRNRDRLGTQGDPRDARPAR